MLGMGIVKHTRYNQTEAISRDSPMRSLAHLISMSMALALCAGCAGRADWIVRDGPTERALRNFRVTEVETAFMNASDAVDYIAALGCRIGVGSGITQVIDGTNVIYTFVFDPKRGPNEQNCNEQELERLGPEVGFHGSNVSVYDLIHQLATQVEATCAIEQDKVTIKFRWTPPVPYR